MPIRLALLVSALVSLLMAACASTSPTQARAPSLETPSDRRQEIERLSQEISSLRERAGMSAPDAVEDSEGEGSVAEAMDSAEASEPAGERRTRRTCKDVCKISASICKNAESICQLADDLAPDPWASEKCSDAEASCQASKTQCEQC